MERVVDIPLKCSRAVYKTERGYKPFIEAVAYMKCRFLFITFSDTDLMESCRNVQFS